MNNQQHNENIYMEVEDTNPKKGGLVRNRYFDDSGFTEESCGSSNNNTFGHRMMMLGNASGTNNVNSGFGQQVQSRSVVNSSSSSSSFGQSRNQVLKKIYVHHWYRTVIYSTYRIMILHF